MTQPRSKTRSSAPGASRRGFPGQALGAARAALAGACRRPGIVLGAVAIVGGGGAFAWNATMSQSSRHPAPLFAPSSPATTASLLPEPPRRPDFAGVAATPPKPDANRTAEGGGRATASADPIGSMIRSGDAPPPRAPADPKPSQQPRVVSAQKALSKLGYGPLTADGVMGATTRQALERFERDRKLPVTGVLGQRTARQLASVSGIAVD